MGDQRLTALRERILAAVDSAPNGLTLAELQEKLGEQQVWKGEIQEILWRLAAAKRLKITATGQIVKEELVGHGGT